MLVSLSSIFLNARPSTLVSNSCTRYQDLSVVHSSTQLGGGGGGFAKLPIGVTIIRIIAFGGLGSSHYLGQLPYNPSPVSISCSIFFQFGSPLLRVITLIPKP